MAFILERNLSCNDCVSFVHEYDMRHFAQVARVPCLNTRVFRYNTDAGMDTCFLTLVYAHVLTSLYL
jgi:hypothetical protein